LLKSCFEKKIVTPISLYDIELFFSIMIYLIEALLLIKNLQNKGFLESNLKPSLRKFFGRNNDLANRYEEIYRIRRYHGHNKERTKGQTMIYKTLHRKLKIE
jgi:hypothetical protein